MLKLGCIAVLALGLMCVSTAAQSASVRRFAIVVGNNVGGTDVEDLRYAHQDARKLAGVLTELGGYRAEDVTALYEAGAADLWQAVDQAHVKLQSLDPEIRTSILIYYSGHAKMGSLRLGATQVDLIKLRERLAKIPADVRIGIIDACESGVLTRDKGGRRGPSFLFDADDRAPTTGLILISSSSENESSQESDELGGSFFTHYLTSGLRGDADASSDDRVTLGEVYRYTYNKTVSVTAHTRSGTQHPTYSYDLEGQGDIILTDLNLGSGLSFAAPLAGEYLIFDLDHEQVVAEISKQAGLRRQLALPPGRYALKKRMPDHLRMARIQLASRQVVTVDESAMQNVAFEDDYAKGPAAKMRLQRDRVRPNFSFVSVYQGFFSSSARRDLFPSLPLFGLRTDLGPVLAGDLGFELLFGRRANQLLRLEAGQLNYNFFQAELAVSLQWGVNLGPVRLMGGPRVAGLYMQRSFTSGQRLAEQRQDVFNLSPALMAGALFFFDEGRNFSAGITARAGYFPYSVDDNRSLFYGGGGLQLGYRL